MNKATKEALLHAIAEDGFVFENKSQSSLMRFFAKILKPINPNFMNDFCVALNGKIYLPTLSWSSENNGRWCSTVIHEWQHLRDARSLTRPVFYLTYAMPQVLVFLALLGFVAPLAWLFLLCLTPLPAFGRLWIEWRATMTSLCLFHRTTGMVYPRFKHEQRAKKWCSGAYYFMWPFKSHIVSALMKASAKIENGEYPSYAQETLRKLEEAKLDSKEVI